MLTQKDEVCITEVFFYCKVMLICINCETVRLFNQPPADATEPLPAPLQDFPDAGGGGDGGELRRGQLPHEPARSPAEAARGGGGGGGHGVRPGRQTAGHAARVPSGECVCALLFPKLKCP